MISIFELFGRMKEDDAAREYAYNMAKLHALARSKLAKSAAQKQAMEAEAGKISNPIARKFAQMKLASQGDNPDDEKTKKILFKAKQGLQRWRDTGGHIPKEGRQDMPGFGDNEIHKFSEKTGEFEHMGKLMNKLKGLAVDY